VSILRYKRIISNAIIVIIDNTTRMEKGNMNINNHNDNNNIMIDIKHNLI